MSDHTGYHDRHGIPIHVGDLLRIYHYRHRRNGRVMYMFFRVAKIDGRYVVQNWDEPDTTQWQCLLQHADIRRSDVVDASVLQRDKYGGIVTFNERKRKRGRA